MNVEIQDQIVVQQPASTVLTPGWKYMRNKKGKVKYLSPDGTLHKRLPWWTRRINKKTGVVKYLSSDDTFNKILQRTPFPKTKGFYNTEDSNLRTELNKQINNNEWFILSKEDCKFCHKSIDLLSSRGQHFGMFTFDKDGNPKSIAESIKDSLDYKKFPIIFNNSLFIGGYTELKKKIDSLPVVSSI